MAGYGVASTLISLTQIPVLKPNIFSAVGFSWNAWALVELVKNCPNCLTSFEPSENILKGIPENVYHVLQQVADQNLIFNESVPILADRVVKKIERDPFIQDGARAVLMNNLKVVGIHACSVLFLAINLSYHTWYFYGKKLN